MLQFIPAQTDPFASVMDCALPTISVSLMLSREESIFESESVRPLSNI